MKKLELCQVFPFRDKLSQMFRIMKFTTLLVLITTLQLSASVYSQRTTFNMEFKGASVLDLMEEIKRNSEFDFVYSDDEIENVGINDANFSGSHVEEILDRCLEGTAITYKVEDKVIVLMPAPPKPVINEKQEKKELKGTVTDEDGNTLPGVSVVIKGTTYGVSTDIDGNYKLVMPEMGGILVFSFVGMTAQEIAYTGQDVINVELKADAEGLSEVVVVGYGSTTRDKIGSSIAVVKAEEIEARSAGMASIESVLGGQIKGLNVTQSSGAPGAASNINIRGYTSPFGSGRNQPLFVVDNVVFNTDNAFDQNQTTAAPVNPLLSIDPDDIENISVLKDAAATAIYGSRGANGVIIITTKKGRKNSKLRVDLKSSYSIQNVLNTYDMMDTDEFIDFQRQIAINTIKDHQNRGRNLNGYRQATLIVDPVTFEPIETFTNTRFGSMVTPTFRPGINTDWQDEIYKANAGTQNYSLRLSGGDEKTAYSFSVSHLKQDALLIGDEMQRSSLRANISSDVNDWLKIGGLLSYSNTHIDAAAQNISQGAPWVRPDLRIKDEGGNYERYASLAYGSATPGVGYSSFLYNNPVAGTTSSKLSQAHNSNYNLFAELTPVKDLKIKASYTYSSSISLAKQFIPTSAMSDFYAQDEQSMVTRATNESTYESADIQADYIKVFGDHTLSTMVGYNQNRSRFERINQSYYNTPDDDILINPSSALGSYPVSDAASVSGINSFISRVSYSYDNRYTAIFTFRSDKSSKFGPGKKVAYFPSMAVNWNMKNEKFLADFSRMDKLSLRASLGNTGSANIKDFQYLQYFGVGSSVESKYAEEASIVPSLTFPNEDLGWEKTFEKNIGLDFSFFQRRLYGSIDAYHKYTSGVLVGTPIFEESGASSFTSNLAEVSNKGMEFEIGGDIIRGKDFSWNMNFNIAFNRNALEKIVGANFTPNQLKRYVVGKPLNLIRGYKVEKILETQEEVDALNASAPYNRYHYTNLGVGDYKMVDTNEDGRINSLDYQVLGSSQADYFGGFATQVQYKNFQLSAGFNYNVGSEKSIAYNGYYHGTPRPFHNMVSGIYENSTSAENPDAPNPRMLFNHGYNSQLSDRTIQDASYLRLKVVRLTYTFPKNIIERMNFSSLSMYVSGSNLYTWTNYTGLDPEGSNTRNFTGVQSDSNAYPFAKTFTFGINLGF